jgi:hypothetical protein
MSTEPAAARPLRPTVALVAAALLAALLPLAAALPSTAADTPTVQPAVVPTAPRAYSALIDGFASYQGQTTCTTSAKPGASKLASLLRTTYGGYSIGISRSCSVGGQSEHKEGRALDWMVNAKVASQKARADAFLTWLLATDQYGNVAAMARRLGIMYIGWNDRFWRGYDVERGWTELKGCLTDPAKKAAGYDTYCHRNHVHISLTWEGAMGLTSFWTGSPLPGPCLTGWAPAPPAPVASGAMRLVPAVRVMDTASGQGLAEPCRLSAPRWSGDRTELPVKVTGVGQVPATGVAAVVLRVQALRGSAPTSTVTVRATPSSVAVPVVTRQKTQAVAGTVTSPVSPDGTVRLGLDLGTTDVRVDVLGWAPALTSPAASAVTGLTPVRPVVAYGAFTAPLAAREARTISLAGRAGVPLTGVAGLVVTVETRVTSRAAVLDVLSPGESIPAGRLTTSTSERRSVSVLVPTKDGRIVLRSASGVPIPFRVRVVGWFGTSAGAPLVTQVNPRVVVNTQTGVGLPGTAPTRVGRTFALSAPAGIPAGSSAALVSLGVRASGTTGPAVLRSLWRGHKVNSVSGAWTHGVLLVPLDAGGTGTLTLPAGAHARVTVLGYVA